MSLLLKFLLWFKKICSKPNSINTNHEEDELLGFWENDADDGSGLHAIWGFGIEFLTDGKGFYHHWGGDIEAVDSLTPINWKREGAKALSIRYQAAEAWEVIEYETSDFVGAYNSKYFKLTKKGTEDFWGSYCPLYKLNQHY